MKLFNPRRPKILLFNKFLTKIAHSQKNSLQSGTFKYSMGPYKHETAKLIFGKVIGT